MKHLNILQIILNILVIVIFLGSGIAILILRGVAEEYDAFVLGMTLLIAGFAKGFIYFINKGFTYNRNITIISSAVMIGLGFVFLFSGRDIEMLCFGWGIMEIVLGAIEVYIDLLEIKEDKIAYLELVVNSATILFGILLCINLTDGLTVHLIFVGISLILLSINAINKFIRLLRTNNK